MAVKPPVPAAARGRTSTGGGGSAAAAATAATPQQHRNQVRKNIPPTGAGDISSGVGARQSPPGKQRQSPPSNKSPADAALANRILDECLEDIGRVSWDDIVGLAYAKQTLQEAVILPYRHPELFTGLRAPTKGVLLFGPPGTGKTLLAKAVANESGFKFFSLSASSLTSKWMGEGEKLVRALFMVARELQPSVIFIDEIDSVLSKRSDHEHEASRRLKTEFMVQLDGAATSDDAREDRILVMGATNLPHNLDDAVLRRLSKRVYVPLPDAAARRAMYAQLLPAPGRAAAAAAAARDSKGVINSVTGEQHEQIVALTEGYSCSDIVSLCKEAAMGPVRDLVAAHSGGGGTRSILSGKVLTPESVRPVCLQDVRDALKRIRPSVSPESLAHFSGWERDNS